MRVETSVTLTVNGALVTLEAPPAARLLDVLRERLGLTGTKEGCGEGECGACTVLLDGTPVNACLVAFGQCDGREVTTVEGLGSTAHLTPLQEAMVTEGGAQCGICTPGMLLSAEALLRERPRPTEPEIREAIGVLDRREAIRSFHDLQPVDVRVMDGGVRIHGPVESRVSTPAEGRRNWRAIWPHIFLSGRM